MKKHFILSLLICILTVGVIHINAGAAGKYSYNDMVGFLNAMGILKQMGEDKEASEISRIDFAVLAAKMIGIDEAEPPEADYFYDIPNDHWGKFSVNTLVQRGIISGDGQRLFRPDDTITMPEAAAVIMKLMHKEYEAERAGGYPVGYINIAADYGVITSEVSSVEKLTYKDAVILIYNALNAEMDYMTKGDTLLSVYHNIYYGEGQLSAVYGASVNENSISKINQVCIDGTIFETKTEWLYDRLGVYVKYYYIDDGNGGSTIIYVSSDNEGKNKIVEITSDYYDGFNDGQVFYYTDLLKSRKKALDIYKGVTVIRNGKNMSDDLDAAFAEFYGYMKLIQTKAHSEFDIVVIEDYENIEVGYINKDENRIYDKSDASISAKLSKDDYDMITYFDADGNEASFDKISIGDIVSIARSDNGRFAKLIISSNQISGVIETTKTTENSTIITIDGTEYEFESEYYKRTTPNVVFEEKVTIKTDLFGKIASYGVVKPDSFKYAYLLNVFVDDDSERLFIKMYTEDSQMVTAMCAKRILIDAVRKSNNKDIINIFSSANQIKPQLIRFKYNADNEVVEIDTKQMGSNESEYSLHLMENEKNMYKHWTNLVGYNAYVPTSVKVLIVPEEGTEKTASEDQFRIKNVSAIPSGKSSRIDLYQLDQNSLNIDFVIYYTDIKSGVDTYASLQVIEKITVGLNSDKEPVKTLRLDSTGTSVNYALSSNYVISENSYTNIDPDLLGKGDIIRIATDHKNEITSIQLVLDYSKAKEDGNDRFFENSLNPAYKAVNGVAVGNFFDGFKMSYGYVARTSGNLIQWGYEKPGDADEVYNVTFDSNKAKILIYDEEDLNDPCKLGTVNDIIGYYMSSEDYSKLVAVSRSAIITNMVVYK